MSEVQTTAEAFAPWLQGGGLLAFAGAVLWQIRKHGDILARMDRVLAVLLDRVGVVTDDNDVVDTVPIRPARTRTPARGARARTNHDTEES